MESVDRFDDETGIFQSMAPEPSEDVRAEALAGIEHQLRHAGPDQDQIAFRLDMALCSLERYAFGREAQPLSTAEFERLSQALAACATQAFREPPTGLDQRQVMCGLLIVAQILHFWSLSDAERAKTPKLRGYLRDLARVFRNALHSANLLNRVRDDLDAGWPWFGGSVPALIDFNAAVGLLHYPADTMRLFIDAMAPAALRQDHRDAA